MLFNDAQRPKGLLMISKASSALLVLPCALFMLPSLAAADSITMRLLAWKDFQPPLDVG
jgi:hypothetical protein